MVFMDIFPVTDGHTLVITKEHFENLFEASAESLEAVARASKRVAGAIHEVPGKPERLQQVARALAAALG